MPTVLQLLRDMIAFIETILARARIDCKRQTVAEGRDNTAIVAALGRSQQQVLGGERKWQERITALTEANYRAPGFKPLCVGQAIFLRLTPRMNSSKSNKWNLRREYTVTCCRPGIEQQG